MNRLFGTDGVRGLANVELTPKLAFEIGMATTYVLKKLRNKKIRVLIGTDTRLSKDMLESAISSGICSMGGDVCVISVIPTPAIAYLTKKYNFDAGVVISASHNKYWDNGIKIFNNNGYKLSDSLEEEIEELIFAGVEKLELPVSEEIGKKEYDTTLADDYIKLLKDSADGTTFENLKVVVDCANGATCNVAQEIFKNFGCEYIIINNSPDGININENCGSTHMEMLKSEVIKQKADLGIAYDGDGDRCLLVDPNGNEVDGDQIMAIYSEYLRSTNNLKNNGFVTTIMSNLGLFNMGKAKNMIIEKAGVGDKFVLQKMLELGYNFGGEQSGHLIFLDYNTTGDGILTSLQVLKIMKQTNKSILELNTEMEVVPQILHNIPVPNAKKRKCLELPKVKEALAGLDSTFAGGRVLARPSGTEPNIRVMVEFDDVELIKKEVLAFEKILLAEIENI